MLLSFLNLNRLLCYLHLFLVSSLKYFIVLFLSGSLAPSQTTCTIWFFFLTDTINLFSEYKQIYITPLLSWQLKKKRAIFRPSLPLQQDSIITYTTLRYQYTYKTFHNKYGLYVLKFLMNLLRYWYLGVSRGSQYPLECLHDIHSYLESLPTVFICRLTHTTP